MKKSLAEDKETLGGIGHENRNNYDGFMKKRAVMSIFPEENKYGEIIDSTNIYDMKSINIDDDCMRKL